MTGYTPEASATSAGPVVGVDNAITLTVKDSSAATDATFNGPHNVTYTVAPDGSFGTLNGIALTVSPNIIEVNFNNGTV